jgi:hypothetical protein
MKHAKIFSLTVVLAIALFGAVGWYFLPLAAYDGDLTRTGKLPESLFGWTRPQPALAPVLFTSARWQDADVLVIGDSFSVGRVWQTQLTGSGLRVHTETWGSVHAICGDFQPWLRSTGFKGRYIVIEVIERNALNTLAASLACDKMVSTPPMGKAEDVGPPPSYVNRGQRLLSGRLSVGIETWWNARKYMRLSAPSRFAQWPVNDLTTVARVPDGCALFSHAACRDALFYGGDQSGDLGAPMLDGMSAINRRLAAYTPIWVIVPDKSTTYLNPRKTFWTLAAARFDAPDMLQDLRRAVHDKVIDLYPANNTHLSTTGYLRLGQLVLAEIRSRQAVKQPNPA